MMRHDLQSITAFTKQSDAEENSLRSSSPAAKETARSPAASSSRDMPRLAVKTRGQGRRFKKQARAGVSRRSEILMQAVGEICKQADARRRYSKLGEE